MKIEITNIKSKSKNKYTIVLDNEKEIDIIEYTLIKHGLYKGMKIEEDLLKEILRDDSIKMAMSLSYKYLVSMRWEKELRDYLYKHNIDKTIINETIEKLIIDKYLDDREYAMCFARDKLIINRYGREKIKSLLYQKGINKNFIQDAIESLDYEVELENLIDAMQRKKSSLEGKKNSKEKLIAHLISKGYTYSMIKEVLWDTMFIF